MAQYLPLGSGLIWPTVKGFEEADEEAERPLTWVSRMGLGKALATAEAEAAEDAADKEAAMAAGATNELESSPGDTHWVLHWFYNIYGYWFTQYISATL